MNAIAAPDTFMKHTSIDSDTHEVLNWQYERTSEQIMAEREAVVEALEVAAAEMQKSGMATEWLSECDAQVAGVSRHINGPLLQQLACVTAHCDMECVEVFRKGK